MNDSVPTYAPTERSRVRRSPKRAAYDRDTVHAIIDAALVCHVGFVTEGTPRVLPTAIARIGQCVYVHGNRHSTMLRALEDGAPACITVTHLDGMVVARSAFHSSMNYRSVVIHAAGARSPARTSAAPSTRWSKASSRDGPAICARRPRRSWPSRP